MGVLNGESLDFYDKIIREVKVTQSKRSGHCGQALCTRTPDDH